MTSASVLFLPIIDWEFRVQRPQHLARCFARAGDRVYYPHLRLAADPPPPELVESGIWRIALRGDPALDPYRDRLPASCVETALASLRELSRDHPLAGCRIVAQLPFWRPLAETARAAFGGLLLFDCMDDFSAFAAHGELRDEEIALASGADLVAVSSQRLFEKLSPYNRRILLVPNGCEPDHFGPACARPVPGDRPVAGFFGGLEEWFDVPLLEALARLRPGWDFWLIGHGHGPEVDRLRALPNVFLVGELPYAELPRLASRFDVGIIPFRITPLTAAADVVKVYEMLAAGLPVVASDLPQLRRLEPFVAVARTPEEFATRIETALAEPPASRARRREAALRHSWVERFLVLSQALEETALQLGKPLKPQRQGPPTWEVLGLTERRWNRTDLLRRIEQLGAEVAALRAQGSRLAGRATALEAERLSLAEQVSSVAAERLALAGQVSALAAERTSLIEQLDRVQAAIERVEGKLSHAEGERAKWERELRRVTSSRWWRLGERLWALRRRLSRSAVGPA